MTYQELLEMKSNRAAKLKEGNDLLTKKDFEAHKNLLAEVAKMNAEIDAAESQLAEEGRAWEAEGQRKVFTPGQEEKPDGYAEAVKSFAAAARAGFPRMKAAGEMLNEGADADGGYTVPPDIVTKILSLRETKESLLGEVRIIPVTTPSGRRTIKKRSQHQGFATVAEAAKFGRTATPQFTTLSYEIEKRGGYLPVTNELMADSDSNIAAVVQEWLADEARVTANREILGVIGAKTAKDLKDLDGILKAWVGLGSAFRSSSKLITNDDGLLWLGTLKDANGRYLLTPNPADPHQLRLCVGPHTLPVKTYDNGTVPTKDGKIPMILGDLKEGVAYWDRQQFSVRVSDTAVAGTLNAFEQDLTLWRGSLRDDCTAWDDEAFINGFISAGSSGTSAGGTGNGGTSEGGGTSDSGKDGPEG
nr:phage major capsid protein [uncultured Oscillibacter sp.]